ncbi:MAG: hypothetical protein A2Y98_00155 [Candidatus Portnoybacteria bacterium RBG_19FT_COMBO_36_7]|uniref:Uncharacterized protein n=1 Tax=Candidatus Portnoybacteria bacterium RBG_19FT_COMBO_36_7 TaxID=1801992 RepID=A0A1G2F8R4_9BACT|nr:MAG: hypothetical protein A2Y98_00155 [Candidatus Portnoybacteria bacterium RBG_19FT_COMBO_36_7]
MDGGIDMNCRTIQALLNNLESIKLRSHFCLTGGGEPLLNEQLPDIAEMLTASPITKRVSLVTSGFQNTEEKERLGKIVNNDKSGKIGVCVSFHKFNKNYIQRLHDTIEFLIGTELIGIDIKVTIGRHDKYLHDELEEVLEKFDFYPLLIDPRDQKRRRMGCFECKIYGDDYYDFLEDSAYLLYCLYANPEREGILRKWHCDKNKIKIILATTQLMQPRGRAKKLPNHAFPYEWLNCPIYFYGGREIDLLIDSNGNIHLYTSCRHPTMIIGTVDDDLKKLLRRKKLFKKDALKFLLCDKRMYDRPNSLCSLCPKIKAEQDAKSNN